MKIFYQNWHFRIFFHPQAACPWFHPWFDARNQELELKQTKTTNIFPTFWEWWLKEGHWKENSERNGKKKFLPLIYTKKSRCQQIISNLLKIDTAVHFQWRTFPTGSLNKAHGNVKAVFWLRMSEVSASAAKWSVGVVNVSVTSAMQSNIAHGRVGISKLLIIWAVSQAKLSEHHAKCTWRKCFENPLLLYISKTPQSAFRWLSSTVVLRCLCPIKQV